MYALIYKYGWYDAPCIRSETVKQVGRWIKGPLVINHMGHWDTECITFGLEPVKGNSRESDRKGLAHTRGMLRDGNFPRIAPVEVSREEALYAATMAGAYTMHAEDILGSIETGKLADFVVIPVDYMTIPAEDICSRLGFLTPVRKITTIIAPAVIIVSFVFWLWRICHLIN